MEKKIGASEARRKFGEVLQAVRVGDTFLVERRGQPAAVIVPIALYEKHKQRELFDSIRAAAERANMSPEEADKLAEEAVRAVRAEGKKGKRGAGSRDEG